MRAAKEWHYPQGLKFRKSRDDKLYCSNKSILKSNKKSAQIRFKDSDLS